MIIFNYRDHNVPKGDIFFMCAQVKELCGVTLQHITQILVIFFRGRGILLTVFSRSPYLLKLRHYFMHKYNK